MKIPVAWNVDFVDAQYELWKADPTRVSREWQLFFQGFELGADGGGKPCEPADKDQILRQVHVEELIYRYRDVGHLMACLDPLQSCSVDHPLLALKAFHLTEEDLDRKFHTPHLASQGEARLRDILALLKETYCRTVGVEYMHLQDPAERRWLQERMEPSRNRPSLDDASKLRILEKIGQAELFDRFLHTKYVGQKRFSIEGADVIVPMLDMLTLHAARWQCREIILGTAHRGRLNIQVNVLGKPYEAVFCEFEDSYDPEALVGSGDVKYHKGYMTDVDLPDGGKVRLQLATNPSHLESVNPVVEGMARARQEQAGGNGSEQVLPVLIHGDAAFSGQGVVFETLNLSQLEGYRTGGTIHLVIDNQIGFTTLPEDARSTRYSTDVAKMLMAPIFHVHGEDPEAAVHVVRLAWDYRRTFAKDVVIDVVCYRRYGHNEGDEPYYTQPLMYDRIKDRPSLFEIYGKKLQQEGLVDSQSLDRMREAINGELAKAYDAMHGKQCPVAPVALYETWSDFSGAYDDGPVKTGVAEDRLLDLARRLQEVPDGFSMHPKLERILKRRLEAVEAGEGIDWANAESLALGALLMDDVPVRLSGQDSRRGTFSQRHCVLVDVHTGEHYAPLDHLQGSQGRFSAYDSLLSENAVLGFDYGYSLTSPRSLVIWEAQFGDFANNAQVVIDQYISAGQAKWQVLSGLVMLLPHGLEGQGPEHSSARLERFLQLCAQDNFQVCHPTTPAQYFHLLRRQAMRKVRKPLVIMTPKSLLRHPLAVSRLLDLASGRFEESIDDPQIGPGARRVLICSGKVYYDLVERREKAAADEPAILRIEQLYPFPHEALKTVVSRYRDAEEWIWVQEEPRNMGGWSFVRPRLKEILGKEPRYIGRGEAASPASGHLRIYRQEQSALLDEAVGPLEH